MEQLTIGYIKNHLAQTPVIFSRGEHIFLLGTYALIDSDPGSWEYRYSFDGSYGEYEVAISRDEHDHQSLASSCSCPYPYSGCKHTVAAFLDMAKRHKHKEQLESVSGGAIAEEYLNPEEIREIALESRRDRAKYEQLTLEPSEMFKGPHEVRGKNGQGYTVTLYQAHEERGHCTCPDFSVNHLETCKHLIFTYNSLKKNKLLAQQASDEVFPFVHITWSSRLQKPVCYFEQIEDQDLRNSITELFSDGGVYVKEDLQPLFELYSAYAENTSVIQFDEWLIKRIEDIFFDQETEALARDYQPDLSFLYTKLYPYQEEGVKFALFRRSSVIADEMGLGKTLQAIAVSLLKRELFGFRKALIVCPASLKNQWKLEIEKFTDERALVISGPKQERQRMYLKDETYLKITNYEAVLRDVTTLMQWEPDLIILDEAQRIKNFETKTHQAIKSIPHAHSLVITGTPLENKLDDLYSIVQFSDPNLLTPLWAFAANHYAMSREGKHRILGYHNLDLVREKVKPLIIRRTKREVFDSLPEITQNTYFLDLSKEQNEIHQGYLHSLMQIITKKILTPMDLRRMQKILLCMRMVCNSTYLIDKNTNISPKLVELVSILRELVIEGNRKVVIFSEWTTMTYLIGKVLSELGIDFVEFSGKIPVNKRQLLIEEFRTNPSCMAFLATDAGGVGLNLQHCDCLINVEMPWNPARLNQRIGRVHRIGQKSSKVNVINLITRNSIEEKVYAGIGLKQELFDAVLIGGKDAVDFSTQNKNRFLDQIRSMFGEELLDETKHDVYVPVERPELDEQTPHYLNPEVFQQDEQEIDVTREEGDDSMVQEMLPDDKQPQERSMDPAQLEAVLNQGMAFLNTLTQAATGKALFDAGASKAVEIDRETGEVVLRFKL